MRITLDVDNKQIIVPDTYYGAVDKMNKAPWKRPKSEDKKIVMCSTSRDAWEEASKSRLFARLT